MSRTVPASMATMYASREHTRAKCFYGVARDGSILAFTDHDRDLIVDLEDISDEPVTFRALGSMKISDISTSAGLSTDSCEISGPLGPVVTETAILGKRYARARVRIFEVDWRKRWPDPEANDKTYLFGGRVGEGSVEGNQFTLECRSLTDYYNQSIGRTLSPYCTADFGDGQCRKERPSVLATIVESISAFKFRVDLGGDYIDDWFNAGHAAFMSGELAGLPEMEVFDYIGATGTVELLAPMADVPQLGDLLIVSRGCSKLKLSDDPTIPTCLSYSNVVNFRGFSQVPGSDVYLKVALPGADGA